MSAGYEPSPGERGPWGVYPGEAPRPLGDVFGLESETVELGKQKVQELRADLEVSRELARCRRALARIARLPLTTRVAGAVTIAEDALRREQ